MHNMFQGYMSDKGFANLYFLKCADFGVLYEYNKFHKIYQNNYIHAPDAFDNHLPNDQGHMNQQGHQLLADLVYQKLSI